MAAYVRRPTVICWRLRPWARACDLSSWWIFTMFISSRMRTKHGTHLIQTRTVWPPTATKCQRSRPESGRRGCANVSLRPPIDALRCEVDLFRAATRWHRRSPRDVHHLLTNCKLVHANSPDLIPWVTQKNKQNRSRESRKLLAVSASAEP